MQKKIQDGGLVAILGFQLTWNSIVHILWYVQISSINVESIAETFLEIMRVKVNQRWRPGGNIGFLTSLKFNSTCTLICTNTLYKFQINSWNCSWDNVCKRKSQMAAILDFRLAWNSIAHSLWYVPAFSENFKSIAEMVFEIMHAKGEQVEKLITIRQPLMAGL